MRNSTIEDIDVTQGGVVTMLYSTYKKHYSDCEKIYGSYNKDSKTIRVIIPAGRMKASGVRGRIFCTYRVEYANETGEYYTNIKAVCAKNAIKRAKKAGVIPLRVRIGYDSNSPVCWTSEQGFLRDENC